MFFKPGRDFRLVLDTDHNECCTGDFYADLNVTLDADGQRAAEVILFRGDLRAQKMGNMIVHMQVYGVGLTAEPRVTKAIHDLLAQDGIDAARVTIHNDTSRLDHEPRQFIYPQIAPVPRPTRAPQRRGPKP